MNKKYAKGYSLLELIIVLGILGIIISSIGSFFLMNLRASKNADEQLEVQSQLQNAINILADRLQNSISIICSDNINEKAYTVMYYKDIDSSSTISDEIKLNKSNHKMLLNDIEAGSYINDISLIPINEEGNEFAAEAYDTVKELNNLLMSVKIVRVKVTAQKGNTVQELATMLYRRNL